MILAKKGEGPAIFNALGEVDENLSGRSTSTPANSNETSTTSKPAAVLAVQIGNHQDWPAILIACLRRGLVVLPLEKSINEHQRDVALKICRVSAIIESPELVRKIDNEPPNWTAKTPSLLKLTSGTTAEPRAIRFRSEQLLADCNQICDTMGISETDLNFGVIPVSHSYGFSNLLTPLIARGVPMVMSRDRTPRAVLDDLGAHKRDRLSRNASLLSGVLRNGKCSAASKAPALHFGRSAIANGRCEKISATDFGMPIHSFYGASECGGICYDREGASDIEGYVGTPMKGVDLEMIDGKSESSQVRVRSAAAGDGYFPERDDEKLHTGVFLPDDLLARHHDGFKIVGRVSDVINVAGKKVNPSEIEEALLRFRGVRQAVAFGRPAAAGLRNEEVAACVVGECRSQKRSICWSLAGKR